MSDNVTTSAGTGDGATFASDDIGGIQHTRVKAGFGVDGSYVDVSATDPLPVALPSATTAFLDGLETLIGATNTALATMDTHVDGIEALLGTSNTALQLIDNSAVDHDAATVAGVTQIGLVARSTEPTAVASADATKALGTLLGKQVMLPFAIPASTLQYAAATSGITNTSDVAAVAAAGSGIRNYITGVQVINGHATVSTEVVIKDGSTVIWRGFAQAAGGGCAAKFSPPLRGTANTAINVANITTGSATYFNLQGFVAAE